MTPTFTLRPASINDAPFFYRVIEQTMRELVVATWGAWSEARVQQESLEDSSSPNAQVILVNNVAAGVFLVERHSTHIQLEQIYLLNEYQRLGIGTALIDSLIAEAEPAKIPIRLRVMVLNPAKRFYEQLGFEVINDTPEFIFMEKLS
jgi:ribosomal protein S18 acetylase RimI-like enzyme